VFLLHYGATEIEKFIDDRRDSLFSECLVKSVTEPEPLGTGGAVAYAVDRLRLAGPQLIVNADTWIGSGVPELIENRTDSLAIVWQSNVSRYGRVKVDNSGFISAFCEKSNCLEPGWINGGLCLLRAEHFSGWNGKPLSLETEVFPRIISTSRLKAVPLKTDFIDIGVPRDYLRFCRWQSRGRGGGM
jgi:NDP-sugar pyrophosphorylase family protein